MESGLINTLLDLGINSRIEDALVYTQSSHCTPMTIHKYLAGWKPYNVSVVGDKVSNDSSLLWNSLLLGPSGNSNATTSFSTADSSYNSPNDINSEAYNLE